MTNPRTRVLLTGFRPFGTHAHNPSGEVAERLGASPPADTDVVALVLPVVYDAAFEPVREQLAGGGFDAVLHLGLAANRDTPEFERFALNWRGAPGPDEAGVTICGEPIEPGGPAACISTLPADLLAGAVAAAGVPCRTSAHAGTFLCNQVLFQSLRFVDRAGLRTQAGFLHLPPVRTDAVPLGIDDLARGVAAALKAVDRPGLATRPRAGSRGRASRTPPRPCR